MLCVYAFVAMSVPVDMWCICDHMCLSVKGHVTLHIASSVCVGVNDSLVSMASLHSCALSMMLQQQFRLNLSCCDSLPESTDGP